MRSVSPWLVALAAVAVVAGVVVMAQEEAQPGTGPALVLPGEQPVVAAIPYKYETEYELDPFEPDKLRRTRTIVTHVLVVRSDATTAVKPAP